MNSLYENNVTHIIAYITIKNASMQLLELVLIVLKTQYRDEKITCTCIFGNSKLHPSSHAPVTFDENKKIVKHCENF